MNSKRAKKLRRIVYGGSDYREREYVTLGKSKQIINIAQLEEISTEGTTRKIPRRKIYKHLKKTLRKVPINKLEQTILDG